MSEEDKIVLGFKSSDSKDSNNSIGNVSRNTSKVPEVLCVKTEAKGLTTSKSDPRLAARGGKEASPDTTSTSATAQDENGSDSKGATEKSS